MESFAFIGGIIIGAFLGAFLWELLVAAPNHRKQRRHENRLYDRLFTWQRMAIIAWEERDATHRALDTYGDNTTHSLKVLP